MELVEGKDHPKELPGDPTNAIGKTNGPLLCPTKMLHRKEEVVVVDAGFYILQVMIRSCSHQEVSILAYMFSWLGNQNLYKDKRYWIFCLPKRKLDDYDCFFFA